MAADPASDEEEIWDLLAGSVEEQVDNPPSLPIEVPTEVVTQVDPSTHSVNGNHTVADGGSNDMNSCRNKPDHSSDGDIHSCTIPDNKSTSCTASSPMESQVATNSIPSGPPSKPVRHTSVAHDKKTGMHRIPPSIMEDPELNASIARKLPATHNFEIHRTVWRLQRCQAQKIGLQLPDGLQQWATALADIFQQFVPSIESTTIFGDATFGACCIDDLAARALGVEVLIHYGHSCIVPTDQTTVMTIYVHVDVGFDVSHFVETVRQNFSPDKRLALMGSVQFTPGIKQAIKELNQTFFSHSEGSVVPQLKPLGVGEVLGCTSPIVNDVDAVVFVCDGRFHLESAMIQNPHVKGGFLRYDPFAQTLTRESYAHNEMHTSRRAAIELAKSATFVGLILGTLGRQGSTGVLEEVERLLDKRGVQHFTLLASEISPERLALFHGIGAWVQVACPRLSLDWGDAFEVPLLTSYEAHVAFGDHAYQDVYPMDYYSNRGGPWTNYGAHNGHGGSLGEKFRHLKQRKSMSVEYEDNTN